MNNNYKHIQHINTFQLYQGISKQRPVKMKVFGYLISVADSRPYWSTLCFPSATRRDTHLL